MRILHYLLGTPPVRSGGLVKYALDLAEMQSKEDKVFLLLPGTIAKNTGMRKNISIKRVGTWKGIPQYRIRNPLPIPMGNGILEIEKFTVACDSQIYYKFLKELKPDVIHVHTLMGLHKEFLEEARTLQIPVVYTTHDYFGICPIANMFYKDAVCTCPGEHCGECSRLAFTEKRLLLEQSHAYRMYRNSNLLIRLLRTDFLKKFMRNLRSQLPEKVAEQNKETICKQRQLPTDAEYTKLLSYYRKMFHMVSYFHFNSNVSRQVYEQHLGELLGEVVAISNKNVVDRRVLHKSTGDTLKIGFLGGDVASKGLHHLQKLLNELYMEGKKIELQVYGSLERKKYPFCEYFDAYTDKEQREVFGRMDVLAVPSSWMETFGMVVLEALSYGVPVLMTDKVGAKLLLEKTEKPFGWILPDNEKTWKKCLEDLYEHREKLAIYSNNICLSELELEYGEHIKKIKQLYKNAFHRS